MSISQHVPLSVHHDVALLGWGRQWHWIDTKLGNYVIIASLYSESACKLINRIPGSRLVISSLLSSASRTHVKSRGKPCDSTSILEALPGKLDIKRHSPTSSILYLTGLSSSKFCHRSRYTNILKCQYFLIH